MEVEEEAERHLRQRAGSAKSPTAGSRPWALITVLIFLIATSTLVSKFTDGSSSSLLHPTNERLSHSQDIEEYGSTDDEDLELDAGDVELVSESESANVSQDAISKIVVASAGKGKEQSLDWISQELPDWQAARYMFDGPDSLSEFDGPENQTITKNKGREANVYLTYIITHYHNLPDYMVFIHGQRYQSHNDDPMYDTAPEIRNLRLQYVAENGYTPIRCAWHEGCPGPDNKPLLGHDDGFWETRGLYAQTFQAFFPKVPIPKTIAAPCCAQFAVTREDVLKIPLQRWKKIRRYIYKSHFSLEAVESMKLGLVLEYMWHIIFGKPPIFCGQPAKECYCKKFGLCDLDCPKKERCNGRVWPRPGFALPDHWPDKGQGKNGWPKDGWWKEVP